MKGSPPRGWCTAPLPLVADLNPPNPTAVPADDARVSFIPMSAVAAMSGELELSERRLWKDVRQGYTRFQEGDVLFAKITPCMENGKTAVARKLLGGVGAGSTEFHVLRPSEAITADLLRYYVVQEDFRKAARARMTGTAGQLRVPSAFLEQASLLVPPLPEQHRIVEAIETYFTRLDDAVATLERVQRNLKRYRASVLKAAVEGRLVPTEAELARTERRDYEPASVLLDRILAGRRRRWEKSGRRGKYEEPATPDRSGLPELPEGWCWATLEQLVTSLEGGTAVTAISTFTSRPVLRSSSVRHGHVNLDDHRFLPPSAPRKDDPFIEEGDLLFTRLSGTLEYVGNCAVVPPLGESRLEYPDRIFRGRCAPGVSVAYVQVCFAEAGLRRPLEKAAKSTAGHQRISLSDLRAFRLPMSPLAEQERIAEAVSRHTSVIDSTETSSNRNRARCGRLRQAILKWAFEGKLADQDPSDEPASVLLERIKAEREAAVVMKKNSRDGRKKQRTA